MKYFLYICFFILFSFGAESQENLILNPSFEDTVPCQGKMIPLKFWNSPYGSPDILNKETSKTCTRANPDTNIFGHQYPRTGNTAVGFGVYLPPPQGQLNTAMKKNNKDSQLHEIFYFSFLRYGITKY